MSELEELLTQIFAKHDDVAEPPDAGTAWAALTDAGLLRVGIDESNGGVGGSLADAAAVTVRSAEAGVAGPFVDALFATSHLAARIARTVPPGVVLAATCVHGQPWTRAYDGWHVRATIPALSWVDRCRELWIVGRTDTGDAALVPLTTDDFVTSWVWSRGEDRYDVCIDATFGSDRVVDLPRGAIEELEYVRALGRSCQLVGALRASLRLCCEHTATRRQFGRSLASHQVVQHALAVMCADVAAAEAAVAAATEATGSLGGPLSSEAALAIAAAKTQTSLGATRVARSAHQLHGAIGLAAEHPLHRYTARLWLWRDDDGAERYWSARIVELVRTVYGGDLWSALTAKSA